MTYGRTVAMILACLAPAGAGAADNFVTNGGFEGAFDEQGLAEHWSDNSQWADLDVTYAREADNPHGGRTCQRITCSRLDYGAVQLIPAGGVPLVKGRIYRVRAWLRGDVGPLALQLRLAPEPYTIYTQRSCEVTAKWQELDYLWTATVGDANGRLMLRFTQVGTVWVDDVSVEEVSLAEALRLVPPPQPGNLLHNGTFELGLANWMVSSSSDDWHDAELSVDEGDRGPCLKITVPDGMAVRVSSDVVPLASGYPVLASCRLKGMAAQASFRTNVSRNQMAELKPQWQQIQVRGWRLNFEPDLYGTVQLTLRGPATVWLDDAVLRQDDGGGGDLQRACIVSDRHPLALYHDGETPVLHLRSFTPDGGRPGPLTWLVHDFWDKTVLSGQWQPGGRRQEKAISCTSLARGWYRARVTWRAAGRSFINECSFVVLPPTKRVGDVRTSFFGGHFSITPRHLKLAKAVGIRWLRLHPPNHTKWRVLEPKKGQWNWRDEPIRIALDAGLVLIGSLDRCPTWASSAPPGTPDYAFYTGTGAWLPRDWAEWETYVAKTVRRYRDRIHIWEIWNEPNLTNWLVPREGQARAQAYVEMLEHTTPIVRREHPKAVIIGGCVAQGLQWAAGKRFSLDIIDQGALELMDVFSFHQYISSPVDEGDNPIQKWIPELREHMRKAGKVLPLLNSEGAFADPGMGLTYRPLARDKRRTGEVPIDRMARLQTRQYVTQMALGITQFYYYTMVINGSPVARRWCSFTEGDGQPRPNVAAYAAMTWLLDAATFVRTERPTEDVWVHHFKTPRGALAVAWSRTGTTAHVPFPRAVKAWDLMGAPLRVPDDRRLHITDAAVYVLLGTQ